MLPGSRPEPCEEKNLPETCGDCPSPKEGRRGRDDKIRPGLSRFADGQDNSGAGGWENTAQGFALENKNKRPGK